MSGMGLTATFSDSTVENAVWAATGPGAGAAVGTNFAVTEIGDTYPPNPGYIGPWVISNTSSANLVSLVINAIPGDTVFDRTWGTSEPFGTPNSHEGYTFEVVSGPLLDITATYRNLVAVIGNGPVGDLYATLDINLGAGLATGESLRFNADTDTVGIGVPAPAAVWAGMVLLGGLGVARRIRRR